MIQKSGSGKVPADQVLKTLDDFGKPNGGVDVPGMLKVSAASQRDLVGRAHKNPFQKDIRVGRLDRHS
jgi:hypothetical protein